MSWGNTLFVSAFPSGRLRSVILAAALVFGGCQSPEDGPDATGPVDVGAGMPAIFSAGGANEGIKKVYDEELRARLADVMQATAGDAAVQAGTRRFMFNLFDDAVFPAEVERSEVTEAGRFTLNGALVGVPGSWFSLASTGGSVSATVFHPLRGYYEIEPAGEGVGRVSEFAPDRVPSLRHGMLFPDGSQHTGHEGHDMALPPASLAKASAGAPAVLDLLIVYTQAAVNGAGGEANMKSRIDKAVNDANVAFTNSRINAQLRLVATSLVSYTESGNMGTDLGRLQNKTDGFMDNVHALRTQKGADLVSLIVEQAGGIAGIGYVMTSVNSWFKDWAFTVVGRAYTGSYHTLAHEIGHNLGCAHDRQNSGSPGAYPYAYGHRFYGTNGSQYRDIMAYAPGTPIPYFSNPNVSYQGTATGVPDGQANSADNARTINQTAPVTAGFLPSVILPPPGGTTPWSGTGADVGAPALAGRQAQTTAGWSVTGAGNDIWNTADQFRFVHKTLSGDGELTAKVTSLQNTDPWAKAGVMIRENLTAGSRNAAMFVTPGNGVTFQRRTTAGSSSASTKTAGRAAPYWVRIKRAGSTFTGSVSPDGITWTTTGSVTIAMGSSAYIGLAVTSHNAGALATAAFESITQR